MLGNERTVVLSCALAQILLTDTKTTLEKKAEQLVKFNNGAHNSDDQDSNLFTRCWASDTL